MVKRILIVTFIAFLAVMIYNPIVFFQKESGLPTSTKFYQGQIFTLRKLLRPTDAKSKVYIIIDREEREYISSSWKKHRVLKTNDQKLINELLNIEFRYTESDVATIGSRIIIYSGRKVAYSSSISLDSANLGIQSRYLGWSVPKESQKLLNVCSKFDSYYMPVLIL